VLRRSSSGTGLAAVAVLGYSSWRAPPGAS